LGYFIEQGVAAAAKVVKKVIYISFQSCRFMQCTSYHEVSFMLRFWFSLCMIVNIITSFFLNFFTPHPNPKKKKNNGGFDEDMIRD